MALFIRFAATNGDTVSFGPYEEIRFEGSRLRADAHEAAIAEHSPAGWVTSAGVFMRLEVADDGLVIQGGSGAAESIELGPYRRVSAVDGVLYIEENILAFYDGQNDDWYLFPESKHWRVIRVRSPRS